MGYKKEVEEARKLIKELKNPGTSIVLNKQKAIELLEELSGACEKMDKELDLVHDILMDLYNSNETANADRIRKLLDDLDIIIDV